MFQGKSLVVLNMAARAVRSLSGLKELLPLLVVPGQENDRGPGLNTENEEDIQQSDLALGCLQHWDGQIGRKHCVVVTLGQAD